MGIFLKNTYLLGNIQFSKLFEWFHVPNFVIGDTENQGIAKLDIILSLMVLELLIKG